MKPVPPGAAAPVGRFERLVLVGVFLLYCAVVAATVLHHEPWRDEADSWLMSRDAPVSRMWSYFRHAGHPALLHLLQLPLARGGAPYGAMGALNALVAAAGVAIFLRRAPFPLWLKVLFPFGVVPLFEYGVIARDYALAFALLMATLAVMTGARRQRLATGVCLALLANAHALSLGVAATLAALWAFVDLRPDFVQREPRLRRRAAAALAVAGLGILLSAAQLVPPEDPRVRVGAGLAAGSLVSFSTAFFPVAAGSSNVRPVANLAVCAAGALLGVLVLLFLSRHRAILAWYAVSVAGLSLFFITKTRPFFRHDTFFLLITLAALWLAQARSRTAPRTDPLRLAVWSMLGLSFLVSAVVGVRRAAHDIRKPFSGSREAAALLERADPARGPVVLYRQTCGEAIVPYLGDRPVWYPEQGAFGTYLPWVPPRRFPTPEAAYQFAENSRAWAAPPVFVTCFPVRNPERSGLRLQGVTARPYREFAADERYFIYTKIAR